MRVIESGHVYALDKGGEIRFIKRENGQLIYDGTTNEELLEIVIDRINFLDKKLSCEENVLALQHLTSALDALNTRTTRRIEQNVETLDIAHKSA